MSNKYPILQFLSPETKSIFGKGQFHFNGGDFYRLFRLREEELKKGTENILSPNERLQYMKCYAVAVGSIINRWYKKPDTTIDEDFQIEFFQSGTAYLSRYYEKKPFERFFKEFTSEPKTIEKEKSIANWLIHKAEWYIKSASDLWLRKVYEEKCINYDAVKIAKSEARANGISQEEIDLSDYQDHNCWKADHHKDHGELLAVVPGTVHEDYFKQIDDFIERINDGDNEENDDNLDSLVNRLRLSHTDRIKKLYSYISLNEIRQIESDSMWEVQIFTLKIDEMMLIFQALDYGHGLSTRGKQLLLMQYLLIAIAHLQAYESFIVGDKVIVHTPEQIAFLATVVGQTYTFFNNKYEDQIIIPLSKINPKNEAEKERLKTIRKDKFVEIISNFIKKNIHARYRDCGSQKAQAILATKKSNNISASIEKLPELNLLSTFRDKAHFVLFVQKLIIKQHVSDLFDRKDFIQKFGAKSSKKDLKATLKSILSVLGYEILESGETDSQFFYKGKFGKFKNQYEVAVNSSFRNQKCAVVIKNDKQLSFKEVVDINSELRGHKEHVKYTTIISTQGFEEVEIDKKNISSDERNYRWTQKIDLIKLSSLIKEQYHKLPESEQQRINSLIEELILDF